MSRNAFVGTLIVLMAILFIVMGIQGSLGRVFAVFFVPGELTVTTIDSASLPYTKPLLFPIPNDPTGITQF